MTSGCSFGFQYLHFRENLSRQIFPLQAGVAEVMDANNFVSRPYRVRFVHTLDINFQLRNSANTLNCSTFMSNVIGASSSKKQTVSSSSKLELLTCRF